MINKNFISIIQRFSLTILAVAFAIYLVLSNTAFAIDTQAQDQLETEQAIPSWLEPRPLSVVDLINGGVDPSIFAGSPIVWQPGNALIQYTSGSKSGTNVTVNGKILPTYSSSAFCLGQEGVRDQWAIVAPASTLRIRSNGVDITDKVSSVLYYPANLTQPITGSQGPVRYPQSTLPVQFDSSGRLVLPANMGCHIFFRDGAANGGNIELEFEHNLTQHISANVVGSFENEFKSYYWPGQGSIGHFKSLNDQLVALNGGNGRHDYVKIVPPAEANYILMVFPPISIDAYVQRSLLQTHKQYEASGTYRLRETGQPFTDISVDWITMVGIPMGLHTKDADFSQGAKYLDFFKETTDYRFHAIEAIAFSGDYEDCMTDGGCSESFLRDVSRRRMDTKIYYLKVDRIAPGLTQVPLCSVGPSWTTSDAGNKCNTFRVSSFTDFDLEETEIQNNLQDFLNSSSSTLTSPLSAEIGPLDSSVYLPFIARPAEPEPDNPTANCPCGWFADDGRMLGYVDPP